MSKRQFSKQRATLNLYIETTITTKDNNNSHKHASYENNQIEED